MIDIFTTRRNLNPAAYSLCGKLKNDGFKGPRPQAVGEAVRIVGALVKQKAVEHGEYLSRIAVHALVLPIVCLGFQGRIFTLKLIRISSPKAV